MSASLLWIIHPSVICLSKHDLWVDLTLNLKVVTSPFLSGWWTAICLAKAFLVLPVTMLDLCPLSPCILWYAESPVSPSYLPSFWDRPQTRHVPWYTAPRRVWLAPPSPVSQMRQSGQMHPVWSGLILDNWANKCVWKPFHADIFKSKIIDFENKCFLNSCHPPKKGSFEI